MTWCQKKGIIIALVGKDSILQLHGKFVGNLGVQSLPRNFHGTFVPPTFSWSHRSLQDFGLPRDLFAMFLNAELLLESPQRIPSAVDPQDLFNMFV